MFNLSKKPTFGLDLSDLSFKIVQLKQRKGKLYLASVLKENLPAGLIKRGEIKKEKELTGLIKKALVKVKGEALNTRQVACNLPEEKVFIRIVQLPLMNTEEIAQAVPWEVEAHIPLKLDEVYLDWQMIKPGKKDLDHLDILVAATPRNLIDGYISLLKQSGLKPVVLEPESVAVIRSLIAADNLKPTIIIDLGASGTNFVIYSSSAISFTSHTDISGQLFNQTIVKKMGVTDKEANQLKIKVGLDKTKQKGRVYQALEPVINDLVKEIKDYMTYYQSHATQLHGVDKQVSQGILCGGDSLLINLPSYLSEKLDLPIHLGNPLTNILSINQQKQATLFGKVNLSKREVITYTTALGLALRDFI